MDTVPETITIEGDGGKVRRYVDVKDTVVLIANKYFYRHDKDRLVRLIDPKTGKKRFYRKNSPLLVYDEETNEFLFKSQMYLTEEGIYLNKNSPQVIAIGEKYYRKTYCVLIGDKYYLKTDTRVVKCPASGVYFIKGTGSVLSEIYYKGGLEVSPEYKTKTLMGGEIILNKDYFEYVDDVSGDLIGVHVNTVRNERTVQVFYDFQDKTNPQEKRVILKYALERDILNAPKTGNWVQMTLTGNPGMGNIYYIHKNNRAYVEDCIEKHIKPRYLSKMQSIKESLNANYSDIDDDENKAKIFEIISEPFPGKQVLHQPRTFGIPIKSRYFNKTGGFKYSFGVELETSQGLVTHPEIMEKLHLLSVGDRSVGAGEYVTSPMMGNEGVAILKEICDLLNQNTLVDDKCGLHVHIGSLFQPNDKKQKPGDKDGPSFSKQFIMNAINLGALIEPELYSAMPQNRTPTLYHCHSIKRFSPITEENFDNNLGAYLFGPYEWWLPPNDKCHTTLFDFSKYRLGPGRNRQTQVGQWAEARYKWLNLIPSYTASKHRTIEFRIFAGTTVFEKAYAALLTSIAFTYIADNQPTMIKPGITLSQMFEKSFSKHPDIVAFLNEFYTKRKAKFNRKNVYVDSKGKALDFPFLK